MIYKYCPPNAHSLENLRNLALYCRRLDDFNDPFEFWARFKKGRPTESERSRLDAAFAAWGLPGADPDEIERQFGWKDFFDSLEDGQPDFEQMFANVRITCFSSDPQNLLMWSHYADGLRGFCVAIDETEIEKDESIYLTKVEYLDAPPEVDCFVYAVAQDQYDHNRMVDHEAGTAARHASQAIVTDYRIAADEAFDQMTTFWRHAFASKPKEWVYEQEVRLMLFDHHTREPALWNYPAQAIRQIIVGERMDQTYRSSLMEVCRRIPGVSIVQGTRSKQAYAIEIAAQ